MGKTLWITRGCGGEVGPGRLLRWPPQPGDRSLAREERPSEAARDLVRILGPTTRQDGLLQRRGRRGRGRGPSVDDGVAPLFLRPVPDPNVGSAPASTRTTVVGKVSEFDPMW